MSLPVPRPPGPRGGPFGLLNLLTFQRDTLGFLTRTAAQYGELSYFRMAAFHFYLLNSPELVQEAVVRQSDKIEKWQRQTDTWGDAVGHSTLTMEGPRWQQHRRILNPSFRATVVHRYYDVVVRHARRLCARWEAGRDVEMMFEMMRTTMGIIADVIFSVADIERDAADLNRALTDVFEVLTARTVALQPPPIWVPTPANLRIRRASAVIERFIMGMIARRRAQGGEQRDILGDLLHARDEETGAQLSDREICNELKTFFGAGYETTALMLMWGLHLLAQNSDKQALLREEVDRVLGERVPTIADLKAMPYTEQVLNETMRIYPPAWSMMVRRARAELSLGGTTVPAGSVMLIPMWVIHRNPRIYPEPLRFEPARFAGEWRKRMPQYAFFPFGGGPHVCLGAHLSVFEGQLILPMLIQRLAFEPVPQPEPQLQALLTLRPRGGLRIRPVARPPVVAPMKAELSA